MKSRDSLSTKIILVVETILLFSSALFCVASVYWGQVGIRKAIQQRMLDIANCAAGSVDGDILETLGAGSEGTPGYRTVYNSMAVFRDNAELEYVYAIRDEGDGRFTFIVDTDLDDPGAYGEEVQYTEALNRAAGGMTAVDEVPYSDKWGSFYSAYSPVFNSFGKVAGIVAADFSVEWFDAQMAAQTQSNIVSYIVILIGTVLATAALCVITLRPFVRQQEQLLEEKVTAESANQAKSEFLANMSHEIRTPINAVLGMNEMILRESREGRELQPDRPDETREKFDQIGEYAREVESAGRSLLGIINDILDFSRIEAGRMELVKGRYQLRSLLNAVSSMIRFKAQEKGLEYSTDVDETLPDNLFGDEIRVREILTNILSNAVKYTDRGFVRLTVRAGEQDGSTIRIVFVVEDSGIGIRRKDMEKLFSKFQRLDLEHNSTQEGSGLGLAITRGLLELMGGSISVQSEYEKGSVFTLEIPQLILSDEAAAEEPAQAEQDVPDGGTLRAPEARILIVDDTKMNLTVTVSLLKRTGIQADTALSGAEALELAAEKRYDLILMDQRMPEMDGTETLRHIRRLRGNPNSGIPVICLTADAIVGARERYLAEGFADYLTKPVDSRKLEAMLIKYLPKEKTEIIPGPEPSGGSLPEAAGGGLEEAGLREAGIEPETGLHYCRGDEGLYRSLLAEYTREYPAKSEAMRRSFRARDWKNYGIYVHALKSTSRMLGIQDLSDAAARLEAAAKNEDGETILRGHVPLLTRYGAVVRAIRSALRIPEPEATPEEKPEEAADDPEVFEFEPDEIQRETET